MIHLKTNYKSSAVAKMGDRLTTVNMGWKVFEDTNHQRITIWSQRQVLLFETIGYRRHSQGITHFQEFIFIQRKYSVGISSGCADCQTFRSEI